MNSTAEKSFSWPETETVESTLDPSLTMSVIEEEVPSLTVATIAGMIVIMLIAIATVFLLGVLIDCRQQRLMAKKVGEVRRFKNKTHDNRNNEDDSASIANNMEQPGMSSPPVEVITHIA